MAEQLKMNIDLNQLKPRLCSCGSEKFVQTFILREVSALVSPNGQAGVLYFQKGFACLECNKPADLSPPKEEEKKSNLILVS